MNVYQINNFYIYAKSYFSALEEYAQETNLRVEKPYSFRTFNNSTFLIAENLELEILKLSEDFMSKKYFSCLCTTSCGNAVGSDGRCTLSLLSIYNSKRGTSSKRAVILAFDEQ